MNYEEFKENLAEDLKQQLSAGEIGPVDVQFHEVNKVNTSYDAITVKPEGANIGVNIDATQFFEKYQETGDYNEIFEIATGIAEKGLSQSPEVDISAISDYDAMKEKLSMEVISKDTNADILQNVPHEDMEDMAVVYRLVLDSDSVGRSSILVTNKMLDNYGISAEQLHADAMENAPVVRPAQIKGMSEVLYELMGADAAAIGIPQIDPKDEQFFVATVPDKTGGAGVLAYPNFMEDAAEKIGGSYYVLPSSLHEVILVPDDGRMTSTELEAMVKEVNATQIPAEDKLTDHVYHYDADEHVFEMADKFEARQQAKDEISEGEHEQGSILQDLKDAKKEIASKPQEVKTPGKDEKSKGGMAI